MKPWGSHIRRHLSALTPALLAGCAGAPPPEPAPPLPPPPASVASPAPPPPPEFKPDPAGATAGLGEFQPLRAARPTSQINLGSEEIVGFGKGVLAYGTLISRKNSSQCMVGGKSRNDCHFFRVAPWAQPPQGRGYLGVVTEAAVGAWSGLVSSGGEWTSLSPGEKVIYGVRGTSGLTIDSINEKGEITTLLAQTGYPTELTATHVVELPQGILVAGVENNENELLVVPMQAGDGGKLTPREAVKTGIHLLPFGATASWARGLASPKRKLGYGLWATAPALDAKGEADASFYVAWTEVIPPAKYTPAGVAPKRGGKNGCGRGSRSLSDVSVEKRVHVSRFNADGKRLEDRVIPSVTFGADDEMLRLTIVPTSYGYVLNGLAHGRDGQLKRDAPAAPRAEPLLASPAIPIPPQQTIEAAAYDQKRGEGVAILGEETHQLLTRFDATGEPIGEPIQLEERLAPPALNRSTLALAGDAWANLEPGANAVRVLTGPVAGKLIPIPSDQGWRLPPGPSWILPVDDESVEVVRFLALPRSAIESIGITDRDTALAPVIARVNVKRGEASPWKIVASWFDAEKKPRMQHLSWVGRGADGQLAFFGWLESEKQPLLHRYAVERDEWARPAPLGENSQGKQAVFLSVWKDHAVLFEERASVVSWLNKGLTIQLNREVRASSSGRNTGPLLSPGDLALTAEVGEPVKLGAEAKKVYGACPVSFATGPRRLLLLCVEPPDAKTPGARVGSRVVRY